MKDIKLGNLIDELVEMDRQMEVLKKQIKERKDALIAEAESRTDDQTPTEGGGWSFRFEGHGRCAATVSMPAPTLKSAIKGEGKDIVKIREICGSSFGRLFEQTPSYRPITNIRQDAADLLGRNAPRLLKLITSESSPRVSYETKNIEA